MTERQGLFSPDPAQATPLRLVAAERLGRIQREAEAAVDLRGDDIAAQPDTVVTSVGRVEALHSAVVTLAARVHELSTTTSSFSELLTGRHLDYSDHVRRLSLVAEQSLAEHRRSLAERDETVERLADAVGNISRDLAGILEQVMTSVRQSREVQARNEALSEQLASGFTAATQQLAQQAQEIRDELARASSPRIGASPGAAGLDDLRTEVHGAIDKLREDIGTDLSGLRRLLSRRRKDGEPESDDLAALRTGITGEMEALVRELHDDQVLMMREILASQKEIKKLRDDVARGGGRAVADPGSTPAQLENEMNRLLIELRALRRRPFLDARSTEQPSAPALITARPKKPRPAPDRGAQWAARPMQGKKRSAR